MSKNSFEIGLHQLSEFSAYLQTKEQREAKMLNFHYEKLVEIAADENKVVGLSVDTMPLEDISRIFNLNEVSRVSDPTHEGDGFTETDTYISTNNPNVFIKTSTHSDGTEDFTRSMILYLGNTSDRLEMWRNKFTD